MISSFPTIGQVTRGHDENWGEGGEGRERKRKGGRERERKGVSLFLSSSIIVHSSSYSSFSSFFFFVVGERGEV